MSRPSIPPLRHRSVPPMARGVMLLALLILMALAGIALMAAVDTWTLSRQREREQELLYVGDQYRQAIRRYYQTSPPGAPHELPATLDVLLEDDRFPVPVRHLRRQFVDPMTGKADWALLRVADRIYGVHSMSEMQPIKQAGFPTAYEGFEDKSSYQEWIFAFIAPGQSTVSFPTSSGPTPQGGAAPVLPNPARRGTP